MSLTDHHIIPILNHFCSRGFTGSRVQAFIFQVPRYPFCTQRSTIYIMTIRLVTPRAPKYLISPILSLTDRITTLSLFSIFHNRRVRGFPGWRVHKNSQILISLVHPRHLRAFPNMHLVWFNANNSSCRFRKYHH
jgi:hypothetical protein